MNLLPHETDPCDALSSSIDPRLLRTPRYHEVLLHTIVDRFLRRYSFIHVTILVPRDRFRILIFQPNFIFSVKGLVRINHWPLFFTFSLESEVSSFSYKHLRVADEILCLLHSLYSWRGSINSIQFPSVCVPVQNLFKLFWNRWRVYFVSSGQRIGNQSPISP